MTTPFGRRIVALANRRELGAYVVFELADCTEPVPGQFYMVAAVEEWGGGEDGRPFLPRAVSVLYARGGLVGFLLEDVGPGTHRLCALRPGEEVFLAGPFGRGFVPPGDGRAPLLVGGGVGIPPLAFYQERFGGEALLGFRDAHHAQAAALLSEAAIATDDGSTGHHGYVTDLLEQALADRADELVVYACGPPAMLQAVQRAVASSDATSQLALEAPMACGFGACFGCVVETTDGYKRVCVEGPVFDGAVLV